MLYCQRMDQECVAKRILALVNSARAERCEAQPCGTEQLIDWQMPP